MNPPGIEPWSSGLLANILFIRPMANGPVKYFSIWNRLLSNLNPKYQEEAKSKCSRCPPFSWSYCCIRYAELLITPTHSSWVIECADVEEPVALWFSRVLWAAKFLNSVKICLVFGNEWKLNLLLYFPWTIVKVFFSSVSSLKRSVCRPRQRFRLSGCIYQNVNYF